MNQNTLQLFSVYNEISEHSSEVYKEWIYSNIKSEWNINSVLVVIVSSTIKKISLVVNPRLSIVFHAGDLRIVSVC
jgi:hypothetical protein